MNNIRTKQVIDLLRKTYPHAKIVLNYGNNWELLVSVILSAQCTDKKVNEVTSVLWKKYRSSKFKAQNAKLQLKVKSLEEREILNFSSVSLSELEQDVRSTGFYHNKAKNIQGAARKILGNFGGKIPRTMDEMLTVPGVARKTANIVLGNAYGIISGIAVDTHVQRVTQRLRLVNPEEVGPAKKPLFFVKNSQVIPAKAGIYTNHRDRFRVKQFGLLESESRSRRPELTAEGPGMTTDSKLLDYYKDASPEKIERKLMNVIPKEDWFRFTYWVIEHGRAICKAQKPTCEICPLQKFCPASRI